MRKALAAALLLAACAVPDGAGTSGPATPTGVALDEDALRHRASLLSTRALADNHAIVLLADLLQAAPSRLSGTPGYDAASQWALDAMAQLGLANVRAEECAVPQWLRGSESARVVSPAGPELRVTALGGSVPTPPGGITAEVVEVRSFEQLAALGDGARGRIVFFNRPMPRALRRTFQAYGEAVPQRSNGAIEAGKAGAVAALVRSMTTAVDGFPHTGAMRYDEAVPRVPAAAIATADAESLAALLRDGPVRVELQLGCRTLPDTIDHNVLGELVGTERPQEVVLIGAHLDAWDLGTGAHDDGAGCAHVLEAMRLLQVTGLRPRRTIRAVLFANEEHGLRGAEDYARRHRGELHVAALETDAGGSQPEGFTCSLSGDAASPYRALFEPLRDLGLAPLLTGGGGGADISLLGREGVPLFGLLGAGQRYFDYHHSAQDVLANVNERELALGAAAVAYAASVLADR